MTITVQDVNDNTPTFEHSHFNLTVEEDEEVRNTEESEERERGGED